MGQDLINLYLKLKSTRKVAKVIGVAPSTIWRKMDKAGVLVKKQKITEIKTSDELIIGIYIGLWAGDGCRYYNRGYISKIHIHKENDQLFLFIKDIVNSLFGKEVRKYYDGKNRASVKMHSRFIYDFPEKFLEFQKKNKTKTIHLREQQSKDFMKGFFLGLMLSDGYLKKKLFFNTISEKLAQQMKKILRIHKLNPSIYTHKRSKYGWNDLYMVRLNTQESELAEDLLNNILISIGQNKTYKELKNY